MADTFYLKRGDTSPTLQQTLLNAAGDAVDITGAAVTIHVTDRYGTNVIDAAASISDASVGVVQYELGAIPQGNYEFEFEVVYANSKIETFPNAGFDILVVERDLA